MEQMNPNSKKIADFIYEKPEVMVVLLKKYGYDIDLKTATLQKINEYTFNELYSGRLEFAQDLDKTIANEGYANIIPLVVGALVSIGTSIFSASQAKKQAEKDRQAQKDIASANLASEEKFKYEQLRTESETARTQILANSMNQNRATLYKESTQRISDTWLYVLAMGGSVGILWGLTLMASKD
jgi:carboxylesterase type B